MMSLVNNHTAYNPICAWNPHLCTNKLLHFSIKFDCWSQNRNVILRIETYDYWELISILHHSKLSEHHYMIKHCALRSK
jgi:hypothetical protein